MAQVLLAGPALAGLALAGLALVGFVLAAQAQDAGVGKNRQPTLHWTLDGDTRDHAAGARTTIAKDIEFVTDTVAGIRKQVAVFNGASSSLELPAGSLPTLSSQSSSSSEWSIALWVNSPSDAKDLPGDLLTQYDVTKHSGWHLSLKTNAGVTMNQANHRHLQFGIDSDVLSDWQDCGRPGNALLAFALTVHDGQLFAGTCEPGIDQSGRVYRYDEGGKWIDCGAPDRSNSVTAMAVHQGQLYVGTGKYRVAGSALEESPNTQLGGHVFRYAGNNEKGNAKTGSHKWIDCGQLPGVEAIGGLVEFGGQLYASSLYRPAGFFRYDKDQTWHDCSVYDGKRVEALTVFNGYIYASSYDGGHVYRYDGQQWTDCGLVGENTQTYSFVVYQGQLLVGTWPSGRVYRFEDVDRWTDLGRLGEELEVMGMVVHNGRLLAGSLPLAQVYQYAGQSNWQLLKQLDKTPDVKYRRAWTMAEHGGRLFCSTLPSGRVYAASAGQSAAWEKSFPDGWHHVAAVKRAGKLELFVDGQPVAESNALHVKYLGLDSSVALQIGRGMSDHFHGRMSDVRVYSHALSQDELKSLLK